MFKTIFKACLYILIILFVIVLGVYLVHDLIVYYVTPNTPEPVVIKFVEIVLSIPILGQFISNVVSIFR